MSVQEKRSFFSTVPGLVTGAAGLLTGVVGLLTVSTQLGWIGGDDDGGSSDQPAAQSTATTVRPGSGGGSSGPSAGGTSGTTAANLAFEATPRQITFGGIGGDDQVVTVRNSGNGPIRFEPFTITGPNRDQFRIGQNDCGSTLNAGRTCTVTVTYLKTRAGESTATLVVEPADSPPPAQEIPLKGTRLL